MNAIHFIVALCMIRQGHAELDMCNSLSREIYNTSEECMAAMPQWKGQEFDDLITLSNEPPFNVPTLIQNRVGCIEIFTSKY